MECLTQYTTTEGFCGSRPLLVRHIDFHWKSVKLTNERCTVLLRRYKLFHPHDTAPQHGRQEVWLSSFYFNSLRRVRLWKCLNSMVRLQRSCSPNKLEVWETCVSQPLPGGGGQTETRRARPDIQSLISGSFVALPYFYMPDKKNMMKPTLPGLPFKLSYSYTYLILQLSKDMVSFFLPLLTFSAMDSLCM